MSTQAYTAHRPPRQSATRWVCHEVAPASSLRKIFGPSIPRPMIWGKVPGASSRGCRGMGDARLPAIGLSSCFGTYLSPVSPVSHDLSSSHFLGIGHQIQRLTPGPHLHCTRNRS